MSRRIKQIIKNQSDLNNFLEVLNGELVVMLGIQAAPGTKFQLNDGGIMEVGMYGIYELDLSQLGGVISSIKLQSPSVFPEDSKVIIDMLYEKGGE